jgi:drug/metabolite transporter (DMT)-like permease
MKLHELTPKAERERGIRSWLPMASLALAGCLWGTGFLFGKIALRETTVSDNVAFRFLCGSMVLGPCLLRKGIRLRGKDLGLLVLASVIGVPLQFLVQFAGLRLTTVSHASLIVGTLPMLLALSSVLFLHERLNLVESGALLGSGLGALLIAWSKTNVTTGPQPTSRGDLLVFISMWAAVVSILITKRLMERYDSLQITASMIVLGTIFLVSWVMLSQPWRFRFSPETWTALAAQGIFATAAAYLLWNWGLARVPASRAGVFLNLEPLTGALLGVFVLDETLGTTAILGGAMIIGSAVYFSWPTKAG